MTPDARYQRAQFWLGEGANGKGVLVNIVQALHGRIAAMALDKLVVDVNYLGRSATTIVAGGSGE